ncbi:MAG: DUF2934 domain-containing protein [Methyloprofundus sp.]|nr:DUF2934 domain-containing protein [Methyloprofundus sp.]MDT8426154.1 DUF2934 domain-containing protein [Methyloprofundus sp.]
MSNSTLPSQTHTKGIDPEKFKQMIANLAYLKSEKRGFIVGYEMEDWLAAEQELNEQYDYASRPAE